MQILHSQLQSEINVRTLIMCLAFFAVCDTISVSVSVPDSDLYLYADRHIQATPERRFNTLGQFSVKLNLK